MKNRTLNLLDIARYQKDLLWGKYYYAEFDKNSISNFLLYSYTYKNSKLIEIHEILRKDPNLIFNFIKDLSNKSKAQYFLRELDEQNQILDIEFMHNCGFHRINRFYCFLHEGKEGPNNKKQLNIYCRNANKEDIKTLIEIDALSQLVEYREGLIKPEKFFRLNLDNIYVFSYSNNPSSIVGFTHKSQLEPFKTFTFVFPSKFTEIINDFIQAFAERYIYFEKQDFHFAFVINENQKSSLEFLQSKYQRLWSHQLLILESLHKAKSRKLAISAQHLGLRAAN